jgi:hypothetical protein
MPVAAPEAATVEFFSSAAYDMIGVFERGVGARGVRGVLFRPPIA